MSATARLCNVTTQPGCDVESFNFLERERGLDGLEYHMGMSRGGIEDCSSMTTTELHRDMIALFKSGSWALLPSLDHLQKIYDLYDHNHKLSTPTAARQLFTVTLPQQDYEYELLPVRTPNKLPIYVGEVRHDYPYPNLPRVRTTIHPCFVLGSIFKYTLGDLDYAPNSLANDDSREGLIYSIGIISSLCVNLSWLHGTFDDFLDRPVPTARPDPRPKPKLPPVDDADEEGYSTDQRDRNDPRILIRQRKMQAYMAKHNRRYEEEGEDDEGEGEGEGEDRRPQHRRTRSTSSTSQESIDSSDAQPSTVRRSKRLQSDTSAQSSVASKKRTRFATSSLKDSVSEPPSKQQRSTKRDAAKKKPPTQDSHAVVAEA
ncbi:hypothetical protein BDZ89DRAFT_1116103 [Hymenopellis radicata]|nr:hypothetical protein BDZ89DRAFT_1116103 [Hymenopellis radicata]